MKNTEFSNFDSMTNESAQQSKRNEDVAPVTWLAFCVFVGIAAWLMLPEYGVLFFLVGLILGIKGKGTRS